MKRDLKISASHNFERAFELDNENLSAIMVLEALYFQKKNLKKPYSI